ncbi:hypothetical protein V5799_015623 [Amblyomma americanum]|uniref:Uncharacterized protein n=1 Tax=Amblyomma americanum TaxID=6943 RepID=A0AAQ4F7G6_AMBAM
MASGNLAVNVRGLSSPVASGRDLFQALHGCLVPHITRVPRFAHHREAQSLERDLALLDKILQPPSGGREDVDSQGQLAPAAAAADPPTCPVDDSWIRDGVEGTLVRVLLTREACRIWNHWWKNMQRLARPALGVVAYQFK